MDDEKQCRTCLDSKPLSQFPRSRTSHDGHRHDCWACTKELHPRKTWGKPEVPPAPPGMQVCTACYEPKQVEEFYQHRHRSSGRYTRCKICVNTYNRQRRIDHPEVFAKQNRRKYQKSQETLKEYMRRKRREVKDRNVAWLHAYLRAHPCDRCEEADLACLDFHHRDPSDKTAPIGVMRWYASLDRLIAEVAKCDVLCSNCHRKEHYTQFFI